MITGRTIRIKAKVSPQYIVVHGAIKDESRLNPGPPVVNPVTFGGLIYSDLSGLYGDDPTKRVELWQDSAGTATDAEILAACPGFKPWVIDQIKAYRQTALGNVVKNAGVLAVYDENYRAAVAHTEGQGDTTVMKDGKSATDYLTGFGAYFGMTAGQFAAYIIGENRRVNPTAYQVEQEYLRMAYSIVPASQDVTALLALPAQYKEFCGL